MEKPGDDHQQIGKTKKYFFCNTALRVLKLGGIEY